MKTLGLENKNYREQKKSLYPKKGARQPNEARRFSLIDSYFESFEEAIEEATARRANPGHEGCVTKIVRSSYDDKFVVCSIPDFLILEDSFNFLGRFKRSPYEL